MKTLYQTQKNKISMLAKRNKERVFLALSLLMLITSTAVKAWEDKPHHVMAKTPTISKCEQIAIECSQTATLAVAPNGDLWRLWSQNQQLYFQISDNEGEQFQPAQRVNIPAEKISARNENRPKIAFDNKQGVYLSWAMSREQKFTADVRFSYSADYGKSFSLPITVNDDQLLTGHSFNEILVNKNNEVNIVWLDGRFKVKDRNQQGSALFLGTTTITQAPIKFTNQALANGTCVCCRLAIDYDVDGDLAVLWRHIYGDNIREFAVLTQNKQQAPLQVSHDHWQINGCPHQGGGLSIDQTNRYHMVWFNLGDKGKGIFYGYSDNGGLTISTPLAVGEFNQQAAHPHVSVYQKRVDIVWTQFTGTEHQLWHQFSIDSGKTFSQAQHLASSHSGSDRPFIVKGNKEVDDKTQAQSYISWHRQQQGHWVKKL